MSTIYSLVLLVLLLTAASAVWSEASENEEASGTVEASGTEEAFGTKEMCSNKEVCKQLQRTVAKKAEAHETLCNPADRKRSADRCKAFEEEVQAHKFAYGVFCKEYPYSTSTTEPPMVSSTKAPSTTAPVHTVTTVVYGLPNEPETKRPVPKTCKDIKRLGRNKGDGEYKLYLNWPTSNQTARIYCADMFTSTPLEYVTLPSGKTNNYAIHYHKQSHWVEETRFEKIRIKLPEMTVITDDYRFAVSNVPGVFHAYASAADCLSTKCHAIIIKGSFGVDLTGTSFRLPSYIPYSFESWPSCAKQVFSPLMEPDHLRWSGKCGGYCGLCYPKILSLRHQENPYSTTDPPTKSPTKPPATTAPLPTVVYRLPTEREAKPSVPKTCKDIKRLVGRSKGDGEYKLYLNWPASNQTARIYCADMYTSTPLEYVTLPSGKTNNYAIHYHKRSHRLEETRFEKIRLKLPEMTVITDDYRFAVSNIPGVFHAYASAADCFSYRCNGKRRQGKFGVDLTGTSFRLPSSITYSFHSYPSCVKRVFSPLMDSDHLRWSGKCGEYCGLCYPKILSLRHQENPSSTTDPPPESPTKAPATTAPLPTVVYKFPTQPENKSSVPTTCKDIKRLGRNQGDGEYELYLNITACNKPARIYCADMNTSTPLEYVSLPSGNTSNYAAHYHVKPDKLERTQFEKIRLELPEMTVKTDDYRFASSNAPGFFHNYASAGDCSSSECSDVARRGEFGVNLTGTSFRLPSYIPYSFDSYPSCVEKVFSPLMASDYLRWSGKCGGYCGYCYPKLLSLRHHEC